MNRLPIRWFAIAVLLFAVAPLVQAQTPRIDPAGIPGSLLLCGRGELSVAALDRFVNLAGGKKAKLVFLETGKDPLDEAAMLALAAAAKEKDLRVEIVLLETAKDSLQDATGVWLAQGSDKDWREMLKKHPIGDGLRDVLKRGGVIGVGGAAAELAAASDGFNLLPGGIVEAWTPEQTESKLPDRLMAKPTLVGYQVPPRAAMLIKGRTISAIAKKTTILIAGKPSVREIIVEGKTQADLTALRRSAYDRANMFPPKAVEPPVVEKGTLVIVGGGGSPDGLYRKFVEYAGGEGKANIVIFPTANESPLPKRDAVAAAFKKAGAKKATILYGRTRAEVESKEFLDALKEATGLWFDGGRQWRFVDCYENTKAVPLMFDVLKRGGVIGGTSAGATIQGDYLCRGGVFSNFDIRYQGYERGLGFLQGVAIDQHFTQRKRQKEMTELMKIYPQYLGIGLDEATAIVVKGSIADVIGKGKVHYYDANRKVEKGEPDYEALSAGGRYDLKARKVLSAEK